MKTRLTAVFDDGGESLDRYSIILSNGEIYAASADPFCGVGTYAYHVVQCFAHDLTGQTADQWYNHKKGRYYPGIVPKCRKEYVKQARNDPHWIGHEVQYSQLPEQVQKYITQLINL